MPSVVSLHIFVEVSAIEKLSVVALLLLFHVYIGLDPLLDLVCRLSYLDRVVVVGCEITLLLVEVAERIVAGCALV